MNIIVKACFRKLKKIIAVLGQMPTSARSMFLLFVSLFPLVAISTPGLENVFGQWIEPIYKTILLILLYFVVVNVAKMLEPGPHMDLDSVAHIGVAKMVQKKANYHKKQLKSLPFMRPRILLHLHYLIIHQIF